MALLLALLPKHLNSLHTLAHMGPPAGLQRSTYRWHAQANMHHAGSCWARRVQEQKDSELCLLPYLKNGSAAERIGVPLQTWAIEVSECYLLSPGQLRVVEYLSASASMLLKAQVTA